VYGTRIIYVYEFGCYLNRTQTRLPKVVASVPFSNDISGFTTACKRGERSFKSFNTEICSKPVKRLTLSQAADSLTLEEFDKLMSKTPNNESRPRFAVNPSRENYFADADMYATIRPDWLACVEVTIKVLA